MDREKITMVEGFVVCRRCEDCGVRVDIVSHENGVCTLLCSVCKKEYKFYAGPRNVPME